MVDGKIDLEVEVPSLHLPKLKPGATARDCVDGGPEINGRVRTVPAEDRSARADWAACVSSLDNDPSLRVGMFATRHDRLPAAVAAHRFRAPRSSSVAMARPFRSSATARSETRNIKLGLLSDNTVEVREGIRDGDIVVANAGTSLRDGDAVKTIFADETEQARAR